MRTLIATLSVAALLAGCFEGNVPTRASDDPQAPAIASPVPGASVREIHTAAESRQVENAANGDDGFAATDARLKDTGFQTHILRDLEKGCEYIVAASWTSGASPNVVPRRHRVGGIVTQRCVGAGSGKGYAWIGKGKEMFVSTVRDARMGCEFIAGQDTRSSGMFMVERMYQRADGTMDQVCDIDRELEN